MPLIWPCRSAGTKLFALGLSVEDAATVASICDEARELTTSAAYTSGNASRPRLLLAVAHSDPERCIRSLKGPLHLLAVDPMHPLASLGGLKQLLRKLLRRELRRLRPVVPIQNPEDGPGILLLLHEMSIFMRCAKTLHLCHPGAA